MKLSWTVVKFYVIFNKLLAFLLMYGIIKLWKDGR